MIYTNITHECLVAIMNIPDETFMNDIFTTRALSTIVINLDITGLPLCNEFRAIGCGFAELSEIVNGIVFEGR
jgi:hypothetical protein